MTQATIEQHANTIIEQARLAANDTGASTRKPGVIRYVLGLYDLIFTSWMRGSNESLGMSMGFAILIQSALFNIAVASLSGESYLETAVPTLIGTTILTLLGFFASEDIRNILKDDSKAMRFIRRMNRETDLSNAITEAKKTLPPLDYLEVMKKVNQGVQGTDSYPLSLHPYAGVAGVVAFFGQPEFRFAGEDGFYMYFRDVQGVSGANFLVRFVHQSGALLTSDVFPVTNAPQKARLFEHELLRDRPTKGVFSLRFNLGQSFTSVPGANLYVPYTMEHERARAVYEDPRMEGLRPFIREPEASGNGSPDTLVFTFSPVSDDSDRYYLTDLITHGQIPPR